MRLRQITKDKLETISQYQFSRCTIVKLLTQAPLALLQVKLYVGYYLFAESEVPREKSQPETLMY